MSHVTMPELHERRISSMSRYQRETFDIACRRAAATQYSYFQAAEGTVFEVEGRLRDHIRVGNRYVDLLQIAIWGDVWRRFEAETREAFSRRQV